MEPYSGITTRQSMSCLRSSFGKDPATSANPPEPAKGFASLVQYNILNLNYLRLLKILYYALLLYIYGVRLKSAKRTFVFNYYVFVTYNVIKAGVFANFCVLHNYTV